MAQSGDAEKAAFVQRTGLDGILSALLDAVRGTRTRACAHAHARCARGALRNTVLRTHPRREGCVLTPPLARQCCIEMPDVVGPWAVDFLRKEHPDWLAVGAAELRAREVREELVR